VDTESETQRAKWLLGGVAFFLVSCFFVYDEFAFRLWGREAEATITKVFETKRGTRATGAKALEVEFAFTEDTGLRRRGTMTVEPNWPVPPGGTMTVEYTPGELGRTRPKGQVYWGPIVIFLLALTVVAVFVILLLREANEDAPATPRRAKPRRPD
jgi:hypothetical protein